VPGDPDDDTSDATTDEAPDSEASGRRTQTRRRHQTAGNLDWTSEDDMPLQRSADSSDDQPEPDGSEPADAHASSVYGREPPVLIESPSIDSGGESSGRLDLSNGVVMAILAHMSVMFGLPFFLIPLWQRNDELSLHHARTAGAIYIYFYALLAISPFSCGLFFPLAMLGYVPALVAIYRAIQGRAAGKWGFGQIGEWLFGWVHTDE
jgi:hypothetical protein